MYCSKCGTQNDDNNHKCIKCQALLHEPAVVRIPQVSQDIVPDYLVWSILTTILCCLPVGIVAVIYSSQVKTKLKAGDIDGARNSSKKAKMWCWVSLALGGAIAMIYVIAFIAGFTSH